ncbi:MAG: galactitol-1-phosphate 5-dehydrogenase [Roseburia sp.]|nr:galactitol-1-phosphate 5-dehydrogenase [Roseburia sp.]
MKAFVLHAIKDFRLEEVNRPVPEPGEALVRVRAAGICGSDIPRIYRTGTYHYPLIPGHEFSGEVAELGAGVDKKWLGKRVGVFPLIPCKSCSACGAKRYELCKNYNYLGSRTAGGFAEYVRVPVWNLIELPDRVTFEQAAMLEPMSVAAHAIRRLSVRKEDSILVCGQGTIGLFIVMLLREMGCHLVYVAGNKDFQLLQAGRLGIPREHCCDVREAVLEDWVADRTQGEGVDVFFDCVGKNEVLEQGLNSLAAEGRMMLVGNPASDVELSRNVYWKILRRQLKLQGTWNSSYTHETSDDWHYVLERLEKGRIRPEEMITHRLPLGELMQGFEMMRDKKGDFVKVMGVW